MPRRLVQPGPHYRSSLTREGVETGSAASSAIARVVRRLTDETPLPAPTDQHGIVPLESEEGAVRTWADARSVPKTGLRLWYRADDDVPELIAVTRR